MDPSQETRKRKGELSDENKAAIAHRQRVWQVRKYCQVRPSVVQYSSDGLNSGTEDDASLHGNNETADPALAALLQGVVKQLDADIVMISLLDEHTQYFLSGATGDNINDAEVSLESARWYGCDSVSHHGGLCERTITLEHQAGVPAFYEELDLVKTERTQNLPYVNGTTPDFRHYVGMPITSPSGHNIGTVFAMSKPPAKDDLSEPQQQYLYQTTKHVMRQLVQTVQALEGKRAERYNEALSALLNDRAYEHDQSQESRDSSATSRGPTEVNDLYRAAGERLHEFLDLSGVVFQELSPATQHSTRPYLDEDAVPKDKVIVGKLDPGIATVVPLDAKAVSKILEAFPNGGVLHVDDSGEVPVFSGAISYDPSVLDAATNASLNRSFPRARQIIFTPLWDAVCDRNTALCVGWVLGDDRIFRPETDLNAMFSFCMATMSIILRIESRMLDRVKSDFIGSISHETRSPLHNVLGNLDLALDTTHCSPQLREMLVDARFGATQLLETIDKILLHSGVQGQVAAVPGYQPLHLSNDGSSPHQVGAQHQGHIVEIDQETDGEHSTSGDISLVDFCEEVVEEVAKRMRLSDTILSPTIERKADLSHQDNIHDDGKIDQRDDEFSIIIFDARSTDNCQIGRTSAFRIIFENLLSNAIKFSQSRYCVRSSLRVDRNYCYLDVIDSGRGFSEDFMKHSLFVPFSQQEPVDSGMGLGLSLVKRNVEQLEGKVDFETDETMGSKAAIILPLPKLIAGVEQKLEDGCHPGTAVIPPMPVRDTSELPILKASVYTPKWFDTGDKRGERSVRLLHGSLASTLEAWFQPKITIWHQGSDQGFPDLVFIAHPDLESFQELSGKAFKHVKKVAVCADVGKNSEYDARKIDAASKVADAIITGSILPSKLWRAVTLFFPQIIPSWENVHEKGTSESDEFNPSNDRLPAASDGSGLQSGSSAGVEQFDHRRESSDARLPVRIVKPVQDARQDSKYDSDSTRNADETTPPSAQSKLIGDEPEASVAKHGSRIDDQRSNPQRNSQAKNSSEAPADKERNHQAAVGESGKAKHGTEEQDQEENDDDSSKPPTQPKLLLVDDNNVNLKMLTMFVKKCDIDAANYAQATGGQEAIDLYEKAAGSKGAFDIVFMDLSMPQVSGFDAISAIRRIEDSRSDGNRSQIVALTGLVSDKDRRAAEDAGTDLYITKPAGLKTIKEVIDKWTLGGG